MTAVNPVRGDGTTGLAASDEGAATTPSRSRQGAGQNLPASASHPHSFKKQILPWAGRESPHITASSPALKLIHEATRVEVCQREMHVSALSTLLQTWGGFMMTSTHVQWRLVLPVFFLCCALLAPGATFADRDHGHEGRRAGDRQEILDLISAYSYNYDLNDIPAWLSLFTEDAVWAWYAGPDQTLAVLLDGRQELEDFVAPRRANLAQQGVQMRHYQTNTTFTSFERRRATAKTIVLVTWQYANETAPRAIHTGVYEDTFVKTRDGWKFEERVLFADHN
ncbi:MAG: nuclear transport factor 2 family protein [Gammaproteobacteria bacterium]